MKTQVEVCMTYSTNYNDCNGRFMVDDYMVDNEQTEKLMEQMCQDVLEQTSPDCNEDGGYYEGDYSDVRSYANNVVMAYHQQIEELFGMCNIEVCLKFDTFSI